MKFNADKIYSIKEVAQFTNVGEQTIRNKVKALGIAKGASEKKYCLNAYEVAKLLGIYYKSCYNIYMENSKGSHKGGIDKMELPIPTSKGKIVSAKQYFYIKYFPLYYSEDMEFVYYESKAFLSKTEAEKEREKLIKARTQGKFKYNYIDKVNLKKEELSLENTYFYNFCLDYIGRKNIEDSTRENYLRVINRDVKTYLKNIKIKDLNKTIIRQLFDNELSNGTLLHTVLNMCFNALCDEYDVIPKNYIKGIPKPKTAERNTKKVLTDDELKGFLNIIKGTLLEHAILIVLYCGLREGEVVALQWEDLTFEDNCIIINVNKAVKRDETIGKPKTKNAIREQIIANEYVMNLLKEKKAKAKTKWVCENIQGTSHITKGHLSKYYFKRLGKEIGINISCHTGRRTYASYLQKLDVATATTQRLMGHSSISTTQRYYTYDTATTEDKIRYASQIYSN